MKRTLAVILAILLVVVGGFLVYVFVKPLGAETLAAEHVVLTTNPNDGAVKPGTGEAMVEAWQANGANASVYEWPDEMELGHNMVDDAVNTGKFDEIYPILMDLFTEGEVTAEPLPSGEPIGSSAG